MLNSQTGYPQIMTHSPNMNPITQPAHYTAGRLIEPLEVIESWDLDYHFGNILKYISRAGRKGCETQDLEKALFYLDRLIRNFRAPTLNCYIQKEQKFSIENISHDWELDENLQVALHHLYLATFERMPYHAEKIKTALNRRISTLKNQKNMDAVNQNDSLQEGRL